MLHLDIVQLKQFYASNLGRNVRQFVARAISNLWPFVNNTAKDNDTMLVIGFGVPYVEEYMKSAVNLVLAMPAEQGAATWPVGLPNHVILVDDANLPLQNNVIDRVLLIHSIEYSEQLNALMQEIWRVLTPGGKVLAVVPNRMSFWSGSTKTPFGFGRPFNVLQLRSLFLGHNFTIIKTTSALFAPPFLINISAAISARIEKIGRMLWWFLGGVIIIEAEKQTYASIKEPVFASNSYALSLRARKTATAAAASKDSSKNYSKNS